MESEVCGQMLVLLLAAAIATAADPSHTLASERSSIESTYELTKYLEYQLKEIKDIYLSYLGPPFNEKDFSPPRPNSTALTLPSAATRLELWHGLENQARLAQNQRAYSVLLAAVRELARSTLCPSLRTSLLHFCTGLDGLLGSISALMTTLGYALPPESLSMLSNGGQGEYLQWGARVSRPAPLMNPYRSRAGTRTEPGQRSSQRRSGTKVVREERDDGLDQMERRRGREGRRMESSAAAGRKGGQRERGKVERGRREKREEPLGVMGSHGETESRGMRRRLLSISEDEEENVTPPHQVSANQYSYNLNTHHPDTIREEDGLILNTNKKLTMEEIRESEVHVSFKEQHLRPLRSLLSPTLQPSLSTLSLLYPFVGAGEEHTLLPETVPLSLQRGTALLSPPLSPIFSPLSSSSSSTSTSSLLSVRPNMNDFARKVEGFWILRELQSWLWRSAKDFNRLKKRLRG
ncbi:uncharacterized protein clcf1 [Gouania willdenowi]|uniref:Cardiotrophin-like cytokine factor 1 n=1 Tax=Gouania willdenowi TaxID=441366 RepID=A0A8C5HJV7_GOUWI|nr:cardiotrophin-like cytokine factor 1 [Gouania willdenowi]XP_028315139.1 cardiotrophin-like cytokine factor 1 [Gouania willdenowi]